MVLSMHAEEQYALRAFKAGAGGYLTKDSAAAELVSRCASCSTAARMSRPSISAELVVQQLSGSAPAPSHAELTDRELEVLQRVVAGQRLTDIAHDLHLSIKTVSTHKSRIQDKLGLPNTAALNRYGLENGLGKDDLAKGGGWRDSSACRPASCGSWLRPADGKSGSPRPDRIDVRAASPAVPHARHPRPPRAAQCMGQ